jgi:phenylalanyl-tRNA synthetase beta chain
MHVSVSWLRRYVKTSASSVDIANVLTSRGFTVDGVDEQPMPEHIVVGKIVSLSRHPNADRLQVSEVDIGSEKLQIVTGATNIAVGDFVPIAKIGAVVFSREPSADGVRKSLAINASTLRGIASNGMMCSASELALPGEYDDGIVILDSDSVAGTDFWQAVRFGDAVLDVDVPSNRPDCLSIIGLAREAAAGLGAPFKVPDFDEYAGTSDPGIVVEIADAAICRRLEGQRFSGVGNGRTPFWMSLRLQASRVRSLGLLVDISNFVQLETGQPLHFYDASKIRGARIVARGAKDGEKVVTLDGIERTLAVGTPVIADGDGLVGIAGIFGGQRASVDESTTEVFLESPNFVGAPIRRAALALGLRTEGASRHEKNLPLELVELGRRRAAQLLITAGAKASTVVSAGENPGPPRSVKVRPDRVNQLLGWSLPAKVMCAAIEPIGLATEGSDPFVVSIPYWRTDINEEVDIIEEVARSIGFDKIPEWRVAASPQSVDEGLFVQDSILARSFAASGYAECVTIALGGSKMKSAWERSGLPFWTKLVEVVNPLSDDQRFLRPSLLPGLLTVATRAWERAEGAVRLFEIGHVFRPLESSDEPKPAVGSGAFDENGVLEWPSLCGLAMYPPLSAEESLDRRLLEVKGDIVRAIETLTHEPLSTKSAPRFYFHPGAAADLVVRDRTVAKFGRVHPLVARAYDLPADTYAFMLYLENLPQRKPVRTFELLPRFPGTTRDIAVVVAENISAQDLADACRATAGELCESVRAFDEYRGPQVEAGKKSIALKIALRRKDATITDGEADTTMEKILAGLRDRFAATLRT